MEHDFIRSYFNTEECVRCGFGKVMNENISEEDKNCRSTPLNEQILKELKSVSDLISRAQTIAIEINNAAYRLNALIKKYES